MGLGAGENICWIVGAGSFDGLLDYPQEGDLIIAADGGYTYLKGMGLEPDVLLGDFDSLKRMPEHGHLLRHPSVKDDTDMALAVTYAQEQGYHIFYLYGGLGGRLDHTMGNFQLLTGISKAGDQAYLIGEGQIITAITGERIRFSKKATGMISVFSMDAVANGIWERNLKYQLRDAKMTNVKTLGVSNEFIGEEGSIEVHEGTLLIMWNAENGMPAERQRLLS